MKKQLKAGALLLAPALLMPVIAQAQEAELDQWSGVYAGGRVGYGFQSGGNDETVLFDNNLDGTFNNQVNTSGGVNAFSPGFCGGAASGNAPAAGCRNDSDGVDWAVHLGFDKQFGQLVVGVVGDYGRADVTDSVSAFSTTPASYTLTRELRDNASLRVRAGVALDRTLVYATGGVAWGKIRSSFATTNTANTFVQRGDDDAWGYRLGAGVEQRLGTNFSVGLQYLYTNLKDDDYRVRAQGPVPSTNAFILANPAGTDFARSRDRFDLHNVAVTASYRF